MEQYNFYEEYLKKVDELPKPKLDFQEEDICFIAAAIVLPLVSEINKTTKEIDTKYQNEFDEILLKKFAKQEEKIKALRNELIKLTSFTKQILFSNHFSSEEHYNLYMEEFEKVYKDFLQKE